MATTRFNERLGRELSELTASGTAKGAERVTVAVKPATESHGPRFLLEGHGDKEFLRMNANSYLGLSFNPSVVVAEERAAADFGVGPGAVRFISGTHRSHVELEQALAEFHGREACMLTSSAYTSVLGVISSLTTRETILLSDELNHNCIINAMKLARPKAKRVYKHLDMGELERRIEESVGECESLIVVTDGIFSMRGVYAPLDEITAIIARYNDRFPRDIVLVVDDSHGVGAIGETGRGTEEHTGGASAVEGVDILVATLGKAFGVNGGYIVTNDTIINYLREKNPFYIYTNPITPSESAAALQAVRVLDSEHGRGLLAHLKAMTERFRQGLRDLGFETLDGAHPVVPLMVRDTDKTTEMVRYLFDHGVLATGLNFPVVPQGDQSIRFQIAADHTEADVDFALDLLKSYRDGE